MLLTYPNLCSSSPAHLSNTAEADGIVPDKSTQRCPQAKPALMHALHFLLGELPVEGVLVFFKLDIYFPTWCWLGGAGKNLNYPYP